MNKCVAQQVFPVCFVFSPRTAKEFRLYLSYYLAPSAEYVCYILCLCQGKSIKLTVTNNQTSSFQGEYSQFCWCCLLSQKFLNPVLQLHSFSRNSGG